MTAQTRPSNAVHTSRANLPFTGITSFLRAPVLGPDDDVQADLVVLGAPTDEGSPFMPGSRFGPRSIREHSLRFVTGEAGYFDPASGRRHLRDEMLHGRIVDIGDADVIPTNVSGTFDNITALTARALSSGAVPVVLGGDHAITFPVVRAYCEPLHVVHFDAHLDYMPFVHGVSMTNAHAFRHVAHMGHVQSLVQVGIRSLRTTETMWRDTHADGNTVVTMAEFRRRGPDSLAARIPEGACIYISLDIDVLDLPLVPGCVSAEPCGMTYEELRDALVALTQRTRVVGFDLVEVNPQLDVGTGVTSYLAAHTIVEFLGHLCDSAHWKEMRTGDFSDPPAEAR